MEQLQYIADIAADMPADMYHASGISSTHVPCHGQGLCTVYMHLPQPVGTCLRTPPDTTLVSTIVPAALPPGDADSKICSWHAGNVSTL